MVDKLFVILFGIKVRRSFGIRLRLIQRVVKPNLLAPAISQPFEDINNNSSFYRFSDCAMPKT